MTHAILEKRGHDGALVVRYEGTHLAQNGSEIVFAGRFGFEVRKDYMVFREGDRTIETFYTDRWYNILELHDVDDDRLKGWYCNIARPARISGDAGGVLIVYEDLALDAFVSIVGDLLVLDEDELAELQLPESELANVWAALEQLRGHVARREIPFDKIAVSLRNESDTIPPSP